MTSRIHPTRGRIGRDWTAAPSCGRCGAATRRRGRWRTRRRRGRALGQEKEVLPKHVTPETLRAVIKGLDYLAAQQAEDGSWITGGGQAYPVAMTGLAGTAFLAHGNSPTRGKYSKNVQGAVEFLVRCATPTGLITGPSQDSGQPMHGHGFALMFLASRLRHDHQGVAPPARCRPRSARRSTLTSQGQSAQGGWTYIPGTGDEGSVTVTQVQALRAAHNAGFLVPRAVIEEAVKLPREMPDPRGGDPVLAPLRRRAAAADLGGRRRHPLQRRPVRQHRSPPTA